MKSRKARNLFIVGTAVVAVLLLVLFLFLRKPEEEPEIPQSQPETDVEPAPPEAEPDERPYIDTAISPKDDDTASGENLNTTPGGAEYSATDVEGMTPEEQKNFEEMIDKVLSHEDQNSLLYENTPTDMYRNRVLSVDLPSGGKLSIGCNCTEQDAIYLNPVYEPTENEFVFSEERTAFAFYLKPEYSTGISLWSDDEMSFDVLKPPTTRSFVISDRTYDTLIPSAYLDHTRYGAKWVDENNFHGFDGTDANIGIRIVRLPDGQLMGLAKLHIAFDAATCTYTPAELTLSDVLETKQLTLAEKDELLEKSFAFFCADKTMQKFSVDASAWPLYREKALVEKVDGFYFPKLFNSTGDVAKTNRYTQMDIYAVNMPYPEFGFITVYAAPEREVVKGQRAGVPANENLIPFAYDAAMPFSRAKLVVPANQKDDFFKKTEG